MLRASCPNPCRTIEVPEAQVAELSMLCGFDDDLAKETTATSNRIRGLLTQIHPALERVIDGSSPMCFPAGEFKTGDSDILLGTFTLPDANGGMLGELDFWMSREQFEYWKHTKLTIDVVAGRGSGFSVEAPEGKRFLIRSEIIEFPAR